MTAGKPVVTTQVGGNPELVLHLETGVLVPPEDSWALAEALERVLGDTDSRSEWAALAEVGPVSISACIPW